MANRKHYNDFTFNYQYTGRDRNLTYVTQDQSPGLVSTVSGNSQNCGCEVAISRGSTIKEITTRIDLACKTVEGTENKIREIKRAIARYGYESSVRRNGAQVEITTRVTKGPLGFPNSDGIRQRILLNIEEIVKDSP